MIRFFLIYIILLFISSSAFSQRTYEGRVMDKTTNTSLDVVSVTLLREDSIMVGYSYSNENGYFKVTTPIGKSAAFISFSTMGYKRCLLPIENFENNSVTYLESSPIQIREVKITSNRIRQNNDTLTYSISGFRMPQDRSIEDVLKKMPGIEISESGVIKFQDKPINKFYIEGMDLLEGRYSLASKNMSADMVKEVQVLQGHQPVAALRGKSFSESAALNLVLTDNAKMKIIGSVDAGAGWNHDDSDLLWDNRLLGMIFGKKTQNLSMYKNNNTGKEIAEEIRPLTRADMIKIKSFHEESYFFSSPDTYIADIDRSRYMYNKTHLLTVNHLYKPNEPVDLRLQISALHNETRSEHYSGTSYFYPDYTVIVNEEQHSTGLNNKIDGELMFQVNDSNLFIKNSLSGMFESNKNTLNMFVNEQIVRQKAHPERKNIRNNFEMIRNRKSYSYSLYSDISYFDLPQNMLVSPGLYQDFLNDGQIYENFRQNVTLRSFQSHTYTYLQHKIAGFYLKYNIGVLYNYQSMLSDIELNDNRFISDPLFKNDLSFRQTRVYMEPALNYKNYKWDVQVRFPLSYYQAKCHIELPQSNLLKVNKFLPDPTLNLKYDFNAYWSVSGLSSYSHSFADIRRLYTGYMFSTYRNANAYEPDLKEEASLVNSLYARFNNPLSGLFVSINGFYNIRWSEVINVYNNDDILTLTETRYQPHQSPQWGIGGRISKTLSWWKLYASAGINFSQNRDKQYLDDKEISSMVNLTNFTIDFSLQPNKFLNVQGLSRTFFMYSKQGFQENSSNNTRHYNHTLDINILPSPKFRIKWENSISHSGESGSTITYFADFSIMFVMKRYQIELNGRNIFNNNSFERTYLTNISETFVHYNLRPAEVLMKFMFTF